MADVPVLTIPPPPPKAVLPLSVLPVIVTTLFSTLAIPPPLVARFSAIVESITVSVPVDTCCRPSCWLLMPPPRPMVSFWAIVLSTTVSVPALKIPPPPPVPPVFRVIATLASSSVPWLLIPPPPPMKVPSGARPRVIVTPRMAAVASWSSASTRPDWRPSMMVVSGPLPMMATSPVMQRVVALNDSVPPKAETNGQRLGTLVG